MSWILKLCRVIHQTDTGDTGSRDNMTEDVNIAEDDIDLPDNGNSQIALDGTKLEEMTQISCKIDNKVGR